MVAWRLFWRRHFLNHTEGALIEYQPEYGVTILVEPGHAEQVANAIEQRGFGHLRIYITLRETRYTRPALLRAVDRVRQIGEGRVTSTDIDLRAGEVEVTAATDEDVAWIREAVERNRSSIEAMDVVVVRSPAGGEESESYGGLKMNQSDGDDPCTSGFSVRRTTDDARGVATAGHCKKHGYRLHQVLLDFVKRRYGGNHDVQWHKTPGLADHNWVKDGQAPID